MQRAMRHIQSHLDLRDSSLVSQAQPRTWIAGQLKSRFSVHSYQDLSQCHLAWGERGTRCPALAILYEHTVTANDPSISSQASSVLIQSSISATGLERNGEGCFGFFFKSWQYSVVASSQPDKSINATLPPPPNIFYKKLCNGKMQVKLEKHPGMRDLICNWSISLCLKVLGNVRCFFPRQAVTENS